MIKKIVGSALASLLALAGSAAAEDWPTRPVTMIVPFAAGGPQDTISRLIAQRASEILGQQIVIENVGGAGGTTGSLRARNATPDGYTFVIGSVGTHAQSQTLYKRPPYNAAEDFTPVAFLGETPIALTVRKDLPVNNLQGVRGLRQAERGEDAVRLGGRRLGHASGLRGDQHRARHQHHARAVSRHRSGDAGSARRPHRFPVRDHQHGQPHIDAGAIKALAIMTKARSRCCQPADCAGAGRAGPRSLYLERRLPAQRRAARVVKKLNAVLNQTLDTPSVREKLEGMGVTLPTAEQRTPNSWRSSCGMKSRSGKARSRRARAGGVTSGGSARERAGAAGMDQRQNVNYGPMPRGMGPFSSVVSSRAKVFAAFGVAPRSPGLPAPQSLQFLNIDTLLTILYESERSFSFTALQRKISPCAVPTSSFSPTAGPKFLPLPSAVSCVRGSTARPCRTSAPKPG